MIYIGMYNKTVVYRSCVYDPKDIYIYIYAERPETPNLVLMKKTIFGFLYKKKKKEKMDDKQSR